jgi:putative tryptophan/tyrosine transport system substrate-binding protein
MKRRDFVTCLSGVVAAPVLQPFVARAQQVGGVRRIGVLQDGDENDAALLEGLAAFQEALKNLGWIEGGNVRFEVRYSGGDANRLRRQAEALVHSAPDLIVATGGPPLREVLQYTQTIPIVVASGTDPVAARSVANVARPERNITGFPAAVPSLGSKRVELLKEIAPNIRRIALVFNPDFQSGTLFPSIEAAAAQFGVQAIRTPVRDASEIARALDAFATEPSGGLVIVPPPLRAANREAVIRRAAQHRLPAIYFWRSDVMDGGLMSYGANQLELYRGTAAYVDRILRGAKPNDLPIQFPIRYELAINLKTAKALGLTIPNTLLVSADEVIE